MKEGESTYLESSPSKSEYFSWINNTNEGATEAQTLINLNFFKWLYDEFGMALDIYAFDAGAIDGPRYYGSMDSEKFKRQFPNDFDPVVELAKSFGCRLGLWGGPDGFGNTDDEEQKRTEMMVSLCRDYDFHLFKFDGVCGQLRLLKQGALARELAECRNFSPDLIVLNHRLRLGEAGPYATTWLWEGKESYIDVFMANQATAPHHRQEELSRGVPPKLQRLTEDHGVCLSSCLGFWEDALVLQAFNRDLICAPQIYGNPWFLKDEEFPKLARIFNLHRRFRDILVKGMLLHGKRFGPHAVSRGLGHTRLVTLRNLTWEPAKYMVRLDSSIGLDKVSKAKIHVRRFHPSEKIMGDYEYGSTIEVEVLPFRSCLLLATSGGTGEIGIDGCDYEVEKDLAGKPVVIKILGLPGRTANVSLVSLRQFNKATI
nr:hypothetical protein [Candidatus Sigynarchaeota archaeon]